MSKKAIQRSIFINETLMKLSLIQQLQWLKDNCPKQIVSMVKKRQYLFNYVINNTPILCDNKDDISYCIFWILDNNLSRNLVYRCANCNKILTYKNYKNVIIGYKKFCSPKCSATSEQTRNKYKQTCIKNLGVDSPIKNENIKRQINQTKQKNHGDPNWNNREQAVLTEKQYVKDDPEYFKKKYEKVKNTKQKNHGDPNWNNREQAQLTHAANHNGITHNFKDPKCIENRKITWLKNYGYDHPSKNHDIRIKQQSKYMYCGIHFDTAPEIAFYIYCKDKNIKFIYQPNICFTFIYNDKQHNYFPDFLVNDLLIEIKGDHFFKKDGTMQNPYDHTQDDLYEAKHQCMLKNNVKIFTSKDYIKYILYVEQCYGKNFLKQFKKH